MRRAQIILWLICLILPTGLYALDIPQRPVGYVNDYAGLLSPSAKQQLERTLFDFEQTDSTQVVVAIFSSLDGGSIEDVGIRLAEQWQIGQKGKDNGVILLIFPKDRQLRIEVGYGLEHRLTDLLASQIIRKEITPYFKEGRYDQGVMAGVSAIIQAMRGEYQAEKPGAKGRSLAIPLIFLLIPFLIIFKLMNSLHDNRYSHSGRSRGYWGGGGGWRSGGGGFGGGGGGGFGGGGSSGRW